MHRRCASFFMQPEAVLHSSLPQPLKVGQRPEFAEDLTDQMIGGNTADNAASAVDGCFAMVTHHKETVFGDLVGEIDVTFAQGFFLDVGLVQQDAVEENRAVRFDPDGIARGGDDALDEDFVRVVEGAEVAGLQTVGLGQYDDIAIVEVGLHARTCDLQNGEDQRGNEGSNGSNDDEGVEGAAQQTAEAAAVKLAFELTLQDLRLRQGLPKMFVGLFMGVTVYVAHGEAW